jgi:hypothetical protein
MVRQALFGALLGVALAGVLSCPDEESFDVVREVTKLLIQIRRTSGDRGIRRDSFLGRLSSAVDDGAAAVQARLLCANCRVTFTPCYVSLIAVVDLADGTAMTFVGMFNGWTCAQHLAGSLGEQIALFLEQNLSPAPPQQQEESTDDPSHKTRAQ